MYTYSWLAKKYLRFNFLFDIYMQFVLSKTTHEISVVSPAWPPGFSSLQHVLVSPVQLVQLALLFPWTNLSWRVEWLSSSKLPTLENRKQKSGKQRSISINKKEKNRPRNYNITNLYIEMNTWTAQYRYLQWFTLIAKYVEMAIWIMTTWHTKGFINQRAETRMND